MTTVLTPAVGTDHARIEGPLKVAGTARYAAEHRFDDLAHGWPVQSTVAKGTIASLDTDAVLAMPGVLAVLHHGNAPRLEPAEDTELNVLQSAEVAYRGQFVAIVVAGTPEQAREAAGSLRITYTEAGHDSVLRADHPGLYAPDKINPAFETDTEQGDPDGAMTRAAVVVDEVYGTSGLHNNPMEPHATIAAWDGDTLLLADSTQAPFPVAQTMAAMFGVDPAQVHVTCEHVGGGFGAKGSARPNAVLAAMCARALDRPVKVVLTRQHMFFAVGYRTPTIQHLRLGADDRGRLLAITHDVVEQTSTIFEFAEQTAVATRMMYAAEHRRTTHRLAALDVPTPRWMRAPGECPGMFALESAMDELSYAVGIDPIELRLRNEPTVDPETGKEFSSRHLVECLREGATRFGWADRDPRPGRRRDGRWLVGTGVAAATYPTYTAPSTARARAGTDGRFVVSVAASDIGTGARTALTQIAADALEVDFDAVHIEIADSRIGQAPGAGGSLGTGSWGWAVQKACRQLRDQLADRLGDVPVGGLEVRADTSEDVQAMADLARAAFGAQFVEARVDVVTGEVRVPRMLGVFGVGRVVNPRTARSQFLGAMTMGLSMALHEESILDPAFGEFVNHDFAQYHVAACADVPDIEVHWIDEHDDRLNPVGGKGIGELGIVGAAAAVANAVYHATGVRVRDLPIRLDKLLPGLPTAG